MLKATKVDGVYDKDPEKFDDAVKFDVLDYQTAIEDSSIKVMDKSALGLAAEQKMPVIVYRLDEPDALTRIINEEQVGTKIS